ncbi:MAG: signal peptidase II [Fimbriimonas sp.]
MRAFAATASGRGRSGHRRRKGPAYEAGSGGTRSLRRFPVFLGVLISTLILDQVVKAWVRGAVPPHGSIGGMPIPGVFEITLTYNQGIAFGLFQGAALFMTPVAIAIAGGATWYSLRHQEEGTMSHISMGLLASGALGNLYDRLAFGKVTDMFWFRAIDFPVFNVADACITVATVMLIFTWWRDAAREAASAVPAKTEDA